MELTFNDLLNNAKEYLEDSVKKYHQDELKSSVVSLWSGILLLLKCRLFNIHPIFIAINLMDCVKIDFEYKISYKTHDLVSQNSQFNSNDVDSIFENLNKKFKSLEELYQAIGIEQESKKILLEKHLEKKSIDFNFEFPDSSIDIKTVSYDDIISRLKRFNKYSKTLEDYKKSLMLLRKKRNRLEHYINDITRDELEKIFFKTIPFINDFIEYDLDLSAEGIFNNWHDFLEIQSLSEARLKIVEQYINERQPSMRDISHGAEEAPTSACHECGNEMIGGEGVLYCKYCGEKEYYNMTPLQEPV